MTGVLKLQPVVWRFFSLPQNRKYKIPMKKLILYSVLAIIVLAGCEKLFEGRSPNVETLEVQITANSVIAGGVIIDPKRSINSKGVCWSPKNNLPDFEDYFSEDCLGISREQNNLYFYVSIENLEPNTSYYLRAFASNRVGTAFGQTVEFVTGDN